MTLDLLKLFYLGQPFALAIGLALAVAAFGGAVLSRPVVPLVLYLAVYFVFAQSNFGSLDVYLANPVYSRGSGQLFYPALCWALLLMVFWAWLGRRFANQPALAPSPVRAWLWAWLALLLVHLVVGLVLGQQAADVLDAHGFVHLVWMLPLVVLLHGCARDERTLDGLGRLLVLAALAKALFGLVRLAFFGGDPSNVYQNWGNLGFQLAYFDLCDNLVCLLGAAAAAVMLFIAPAPRQGLGWRVTCALTLVLSVICIVLSYRRTAWGGMALAALWLLWWVDRRARWALLVGAVPVAAAVVAVVVSQRLRAQTGGTDVASFFFDLLGDRYGPESTRLLELKLAWQALTASPVVGIGAWGRYASSQLIPWQVLSGGSFLHSGVLHIAMKAGLVGLVLLAGTVWAFGVEFRRALAVDHPAARVLLLTAPCGLLFLLPDMLFGTPVPQLRTMQMIGLCLGLPGLVAGAARVAGRQVKDRLQ